MYCSQTTTLICHPTATNPLIEKIEVDISWGLAGSLSLNYRLYGLLDGLNIPSSQPAAPGDNLWCHTCFEAFIAPTGQDIYYEFNFAPSGLWAIYQFSGYRHSSSITLKRPPQLTIRQLSDRLELDATLQPESLPAGITLDIGLSAVIETADGHLSYWALTHPAPKPDFHQRDGFTISLAVPPAS